MQKPTQEQLEDLSVEASYRYGSTWETIRAILTERKEFISLLSEAAQYMDSDPIACGCRRIGEGGEVLVERFAGECIFCRIRAATGVPVPGTPEHREYIEKRIAEE
jgi:hypothetical protein